MKKYILISLSCLFCFFTVQAQQFDEKDLGMGIALSVIIPEQDDAFPATAQHYLANKLTQASITNGIAAGSDYSRFFITAFVSLVNKDVLPGPPQQVSLKMEMTLYIADLWDQKIYSSVNLSFVGVGTNETKAYINGIKNFPIESASVKSFIEKGKIKIIEYYKSQCKNIIKQARSLAFQKQYEKAIYLLTSVPSAASPCYDQALDATRDIYQQYIDHLCDVNLAKAKAAWAAEQNTLGAQKAGIFLSQIYPDAKCYEEGTQLYLEIKGKVLDDWKFEMKKWDDLIDLESQRIQAWKTVGSAYGQGQQPSTIIPWLR